MPDGDTIGALMAGGFLRKGVVPSAQRGLAKLLSIDVIT